MIFYKDYGTYVNLDQVIHAWITDGEIHLYFVGGHEHNFRGRLAQLIEYDLTLRSVITENI